MKERGAVPSSAIAPLHGALVVVVNPKKKTEIYLAKQPLAEDRSRLLRLAVSRAGKTFVIPGRALGHAGEGLGCVETTRAALTAARSFAAPRPGRGSGVNVGRAPALKTSEFGRKR